MIHTRIVELALILIGIASVVGCAELSHEIPQEQRDLQEISVVPKDITDLAGLWEYVDNTGSYPITLNGEGKGTYGWQEGRFETTSLREGRWTGVWIQEGNDREGGFEIRFSDDSSVVQGEWWYTRIGKDHDPLQPGGHFTMARPFAIHPAQ